MRLATQAVTANVTPLTALRNPPCRPARGLPFTTPRNGNEGASDPTFRTSATRYRAKDTVRFAQRELLHLTHQALELLVVTEPVPA